MRNKGTVLYNGNEILALMILKRKYILEEERRLICQKDLVQQGKILAHTHTHSQNRDNHHLQEKTTNCGYIEN